MTLNQANDSQLCWNNLIGFWPQEQFDRFSNKQYCIFIEVLKSVPAGQWYGTKTRFLPMRKQRC